MSRLKIKRLQSEQALEPLPHLVILLITLSFESSTVEAVHEVTLGLLYTPIQPFSF